MSKTMAAGARGSFTRLFAICRRVKTIDSLGYARLLLDGDRFGQIARFVDVTSLFQRYMVGE